MKFFSHDTNVRSNRKIRKVLRTHGVTGYAIWWALLEELCLADNNGFQLAADDLWLEGLAESLCLSDHRTLIRVLDTFAEVGLISPQMWAEHTIYVEAIAERGDAYVKKKAKHAETQARHSAKGKTAKAENKADQFAADTSVTNQQPISDYQKGRSDSPYTDPYSYSDLDPEVEEYYAHEETATVDRSEGNRPVSSHSPLPSSENKNSQHPEQPKETIDTAEAPQGNNGSSGHIDSLDKPRASGGNTKSLVYGGNIHKIMTLVGIGQSLGLWATQESLAAFQTALMGELDRLGRKEPARALTAILRGVERRSAPEIEEVRGYWARFDGKKIAPIATESLSWVGSDGQIDAGYTAWVKANAATLDGQMPDGTYKVDLILQTKSSNKLAVAAWTAYQKELNYRAMIDAEAIRRQQEWDDRTALLEAERAAKLARADYAKAS